MQKTVGEIAELIGGVVMGDARLPINGVCGIKEAEGGDITFIANNKYLPLLKETKASCIITSRDTTEPTKTLIHTDNPSLAFVKVVKLYFPTAEKRPSGIHPTAIIGKDASIGEDVSIGPYCVIEDRASVGDKCVIYPNVFVGADTKIGKEALIYPNVSLRERVTIGDRVIVHSGTVIGSDGFGFATVEGVHHKIPQVGIVIIEDDVEIGANVTIDRARFGKTVVGRGTKIDNLVQIAHNVVIGENSIIVAQAGISGSTYIGKGVILAGQAGIVGHITIGDGAIVAAKSGVSKSVPPGECVFGYPARPIEKMKRINACLSRLPELFKNIQKIEERIKKLEEKGDRLLFL